MQTGMGRAETKLGAVATIERRSVAPASITPQTTYVGLEHITGDGEITNQTVEAGELRSNKFAFSERHVLYGKLRPYLRKITRPNAAGVCSTDILPILPGPGLDRDYLFHWLRQPRIVSLATVRSDGVNLPRVSPRTLLELPFSLPPLNEQRRTVAMLDKADAIRRKRRESLILLDALLGSAFVELFGDPVRNEKGWMHARAAAAIYLIEPGTSVKGEDKPPGPTEWAVLKISAVTSGWYLPSECKTVLAPPDRPINPKRGDLLFSRANTRELVAATCLVDRDVDRVFLPDKLWRITANPEVATAEFLRFLFADLRFRRVLTRHATGTSGSMLNLSQEKLLAVQVPLPPLDLQREFGKVVWKAFGLRERMLAAIEQSDDLMKATGWEAFDQQHAGGRQPTAQLVRSLAHMPE